MKFHENVTSASETHVWLSLGDKKMELVHVEYGSSLVNQSLHLDMCHYMLVMLCDRISVLFSHYRLMFPPGNK